MTSFNTEAPLKPFSDTIEAMSNPKYEHTIGLNTFREGDNVYGSWVDRDGQTYYQEGEIIGSEGTGLWVRTQPAGGITEIKRFHCLNHQMRQSVFKKEVSATGSQGTVKAEVIATMNYTLKTIAGTNASTHDDYVKNIPIHKIEVFINGNIWEKELDLTSELMVYNESERLINIAKEHCEKLANAEPIKSFGEKMIELYS